jgi:hypothetical protein
MRADAGRRIKEHTHLKTQPPTKLLHEGPRHVGCGCPGRDRQLNAGVPANRGAWGRGRGRGHAATLGWPGVWKPGGPLAGFRSLQDVAAGRVSQTHQAPRESLASRNWITGWQHQHVLERCSRPV